MRLSLAFPTSHPLALNSLVISLLCSWLTQSVNATLVKDCGVYLAPSYSSKLVCREKQGAKGKVLRSLRSGFMEFEGKCRGFVSEECMLGTRDKSSVTSERQFSSGFRLGLRFLLDGALGRVPYSDIVSRGVGYGGGILGSIPLSHRMVFSLGADYVSLSLSRKLDGSGSISDPTSFEFTQTMQYVAPIALISIRLDLSPVTKEAIEFWVQAGAQYLSPLGGTQTDTSGSTKTLNFEDKPILVVLGPTLTMPVSTSISGSASLQGYYNVAAASGSRLYGARLGIALHLNL